MTPRLDIQRGQYVTLRYRSRRSWRAVITARGYAVSVSTDTIVIRRQPPGPATHAGTIYWWESLDSVDIGVLAEQAERKGEAAE